MVDKIEELSKELSKNVTIKFSMVKNGKILTKEVSGRVGLILGLVKEWLEDSDGGVELRLEHVIGSTK
jgi:hypothetical protein